MCVVTVAGQSQPARRDRKFILFLLNVIKLHRIGNAPKASISFTDFYEVNYFPTYNGFKKAFLIYFQLFDSQDKNSQQRKVFFLILSVSWYWQPVISLCGLRVTFLTWLLAFDENGQQLHIS